MTSPIDESAFSTQRGRRLSISLNSPAHSHLAGLARRRGSIDGMPFPMNSTVGPPLLFRSRTRSNSQTSTVDDLSMFRSLVSKPRAASNASLEIPPEVQDIRRARIPTFDEERILKGEFAV